MANQCTTMLYTSMVVFMALSVLQAAAETDFLDFMALQDLYRTLNSPSQLKGWKASEGDPCGESWTGVSCSGSSVIILKLNGLQLTGTLGTQLSNLHNLKELDISVNNIQAEIPYSLPFNATRINLSCNKLSANLPHTLAYMGKLRHLNLSHNSLLGPIGDVFNGLQNLREMDLSYNNFSRDLPRSIGSLANLRKLFLQHNTFTGSLILLSNLPLTDLNIQENHFSGVIPKQFQNINNLWLGGNNLKAGENDPPWNYPLDIVEGKQNLSSPPASNSNAIENHPSIEFNGHKKKKMGYGGTTVLVVGTLLASFSAFFVGSKIHKSLVRKHSTKDDLEEGTNHSLPVSTMPSGDHSSAHEISPRVSSISSSPSPPPPPSHNRANAVSTRRSYSKKCKIPICAKVYTLSELQSATNSFSESNLLGEGSLGSVYRAEFPNGQVLAVKNIITVSLSLHEEEQFLKVFRNVAQLRHPNIVTLVGYYVNRGQHALLYEFVGNLTLYDALHCKACKKPLSWNIRLKIAIGIARALKYLHSTCLPPMTHSNLKSANVLLDEELMPRLSDSGLAILRPLTSNSVKVKASENAIGDRGYISPDEKGVNGVGAKGDVYAFGVLLLELLTGRKAFDSSVETEEQSLAKWASLRLHDSDALGKMVDLYMRRMISSRVLSQFADIVSLCIQSEGKFRPVMSDVVESLTKLMVINNNNNNSCGNVFQLDGFERSFVSSRTRFKGGGGGVSPTMSVSSI